MRQLIIAYSTEGTTDISFLEDVINRSVAYCVDKYGNIPVEILDVVPINGNGNTFETKYLNVCQQANQIGAELICLHADADDKDDQNVMQTKFAPLRMAIDPFDKTNCCKIVVPVVPVHEIEAWMLANTHLLKQHLGTNKSDADLRLNRPPEAYADPKQAIIDAISIVKQDVGKRFRKNLKIGDLYGPMGQQLEIDDMLRLPSFQKFIDSLHHALIQIHICR